MKTSPTDSLEPTPFDRRRDGVALAIVALSALAIQLPIYDRWISLLDEGAIAQIAVQINQGLPPYEHAVHLAFPGVFYVTAWLYQLFGPSFHVGRVFMVCAFVAFCLVFYGLARSVAGRRVALAVSLLCVVYRIWAFPHWQMLSYTPLAILLLTSSILLLSLDLRAPRRWLPPTAGLVLGLGVLFKQDATVACAVVVAPFLLCMYRLREGEWRPAFSRTLIFGLSAAAPAALLLIAWGPSGRAAEMLYQTIWVPLVAKPMWSPATGEVPYTPFPPIWPPWSMDQDIRTTGFFAYFPSLFLDLHWRDLLSHRLFQESSLPEMFVRGVYLLPYTLLAFFLTLDLARARRRGWTAPAAHTTQRWLLLVFGAALMLSFNRPRDWIHLMILYAPTLLLLGAFVEWLAGPVAGLRRRAVLGVSTAVFLAVGASSIALVVEASRVYVHPLEHPRAGLRVREHVARVLVPLLESLEPPPGGERLALAALPASPALNFLTDRPLATRFLTLLPLEEYPDRDQQILAGFAAHPGLEYVYSLQRASIVARPQDYVPGVFDHLVRSQRLGEGPGELFNGTQPEGLLLARLHPREPEGEHVLDDLAARLDEAEITLNGAVQTGSGQDMATIDRWPFEAPIISVMPPVLPASRVLSYRVSPAEPARLRFGVAMNPDRWSSFLPCTLYFGVRVDGVSVFAEQLDPRRQIEDRRWLWQDLPLSAGQHQIELETATDHGFCAAPLTAGWARPRLVAAP